jgi:uncharacterized protein (TIGR00106 family)
MSVLAEFSIVPLGTGASVSPVVARMIRIVADSGISYKANPMGTVVEGEWDEVMKLIRACHEEALKDAERVLTRISIDERKGAANRIEAKLAAVEQRLGMKLKR